MFARLRCGGNLPMLRPGVDRPLRGNCHPLSCAPDNQVRCVFGSAPYQKPPSMVRNMHAVLKKASWGTRRIFISIRCKKQASTVREGYSVPETPSYGTGRILKGPQNSTCHIERVSKGAQNSLLPHRTHLQCAKRPPLSLFAPTAPSLAPSTALGTRNGPRSEMSRHKKRGSD